MAKGNRVYRKVPKKRTNASYTSEKLKMYRQTQEKLSQVNKKLQALSKGGYSGTWSSRKLMNRLMGGNIDVIDVTRRGKQITGLKASKRLTKTEMVAIQKASQQFLVSKTSTIKGIKSVREQTISSLRGTMSTEKKELTNEEAEFLYDMLGDNDFDDFVSKVGASTMWNLIEDAKDAGDTQQGFLARLERMAITLEDKDLREKAMRIYEKYVI